jgi:hypothetical protein
MRGTERLRNMAFKFPYTVTLNQLYFDSFMLQILFSTYSFTNGRSKLLKLRYLRQHCSNGVFTCKCGPRNY